MLEKVGWVQNVIVSARTGMMLDGHLRVTLALRKGDDTPVPYVEVDVSEEEERLILATLDPIAALAGVDKDKLAPLLGSIDPPTAAVADMLEELAHSNGLASALDDDPNFSPVGLDEQGKLDEKKKVVCPNCGHEFIPG